MQFKKHIHADLIKEYARQKAEGELEYFCWEYYEPAFGKWHKTVHPIFHENDTYRFRMLETHPQYFPELKLGDQVQSEHFTGMVCELNKKFYIIGTRNEGFLGTAQYAQYASSVGLPFFLEGCESLEKLAVRCKNIGYKIQKI